jgi:hypothetical protein
MKSRTQELKEMVKQMEASNSHQKKTQKNSNQPVNKDTYCKWCIIMGIYIAREVQLD